MTKKLIRKTKRPVDKLSVAFASIMAVGLVLSGCSMENGGDAKSAATSDVADSESVLQKLEDADTIEAKKAVFSFGDSWKVTADGEEVGEIKGQTIYSIGDTYSLFSPAGNLVASEAEGYRIVNHRAGLYDYNNKKRGEIQEQFSMFLAEYKIKDAEDKTLGTAKQKFSITMNFDIEGKHGDSEYKISKAAFSMGSKVTIDAQSKDRSVDAVDALWLAVIASEVEDAKSDDSSSKKNR